MGDVYKSFKGESEVVDFFEYISEVINEAYAPLEECDWLFVDMLKELSATENDVGFLRDIWGTFMEECEKWTADRVAYEEVVIKSTNEGFDLIIRYEIANDVYAEFVEWADMYGVVPKDTGESDRDESRQFWVEF